MAPLKKYDVGLGECEGKSSLGRHRRRWEDDNKMDFKEVMCKEVYWNDLARDRNKRHFVVNTLTVGFHRMRGISWLPEDLLASQEDLGLLQLAN